MVAERRERSERSEANNRVLFEIPRYLYIYMSVCKCIVQDRAHLTQVLSRRPLRIWHTGCCSALHFEESPFRSVWTTAPVQLKTARTTTATSAVRVQLPDIGSAGTTTATWAVHAQLPDRRSKRSLISQTAAIGKNAWQLNDYSIFLSLLLLHIIHVPCHIHHLAYCTCSHFPPIPSLLLLIYQIHILLHN